ncbi:BtpA/SgcQ family protein [Halorarum halobium]|uniref:BtpA/SgcQ family protein n=1 Tax=Halorarum halobium TaxID=3075121 RepID=UPI0028B11E7F|nr:BtpA/SgcQ family protein [Halobaculum sp. XH14]
MLESTFGTARPVVGMVHLPPLPGAPQYAGSREALLADARRDAGRLSDGGVDAVMLENFGDAPFYPDDVPKHVVAMMTRAAGEVRDAVDVPVGVNVLRNDANAAVSVAAAAAASFVRVNVHSGARLTDQGLIQGKAHETARLQDRIDADVRVLADHEVKHSTAVGTESAGAESIVDAVQRGLADGTIITGSGTGQGVERADLEAARAAHDEFGLETPLFVGSGVTTESVGEILSVADGVIVGTAFKEDGDVRGPVSEPRVRELVEAAER